MRLAALLFAFAFFNPGMATAQPRTPNPDPAPGTRNPEPGTIEVDPIECWWKTTATAVRVGETFTVVLTCSALQTEAAHVVVDESRLEPTVVQVAPFEVIGGTHAKDVTTAGRRFFQYSYQLRVIAENVFAAAVSLPALEITYKIESRTDGGESLAGRDQAYALPPLAIRVLSIVPDTATDIREAPVATFADVEDTGFRGTAMRVGGWVLIALGGLLLVLALTGLLGRRRTDTPKTRLLSDSLVLQGVLRELVSVREQSRGGWTSDLAGRALAALRVVAAYAAGHPVTQTRQEHHRPATSAPVKATAFSTGHRSAHVGEVVTPPIGSAEDGQLTIDGRFGRSAVVWSSMTSAHTDEELREALTRFAAARYGRAGAFDARLDEGLEAGIRVADRLIANRPAMERLWAR